MLIWLTQLGLSVALPPAVFTLLAVWLNRSLGWGPWVIWVGVILGCVCSVQGLLDSLKLMAKMSKEKKKGPPPVSFNDHE